VIADDELQLGPAQRLDAALGIDLLDGELVARLLLCPIRRIPARHRQESANDHIGGDGQRGLKGQARNESSHHEPPDRGDGRRRLAPDSGPGDHAESSLERIGNINATSPHQPVPRTSETRTAKPCACSRDYTLLPN
jgi:hypothetical protein